jgi:flagellar export protein FliJ
MNKYKFRLEAVLKIRKFKEEARRVELGKLLMELNKIDEQLNHDQKEIDTYYEIQEDNLKSGMPAGKIQILPFLVQGKKRNLELLLIAKRRMEMLIEEKRQELAIARGELKVMEKLHEKDHDEYLRSYRKEMDNKVEEQTRNWLLNKDSNR